MPFKALKLPEDTPAEGPARGFKALQLPPEPPPEALPPTPAPPPEPPGLLSRAGTALKETFGKTPEERARDLAMTPEQRAGRRQALTLGGLGVPITRGPEGFRVGEPGEQAERVLKGMELPRRGAAALKVVTGAAAPFRMGGSVLKGAAHNILQAVRLERGLPLTGPLQTFPSEIKSALIASYPDLGRVWTPENEAFHEDLRKTVFDDLTQTTKKLEATGDTTAVYWGTFAQELSTRAADMALDLIGAGMPVRGAPKPTTAIRPYGETAPAAALETARTHAEKVLYEGDFMARMTRGAATEADVAMANRVVKIIYRQYGLEGKAFKVTVDDLNAAARRSPAAQPGPAGVRQPPPTVPETPSLLSEELAKTATVDLRNEAVALGWQVEQVARMRRPELEHVVSGGRLGTPPQARPVAPGEAQQAPPVAPPAPIQPAQAPTQPAPALMAQTPVPAPVPEAPKPAPAAVAPPGPAGGAPGVVVPEPTVSLTVSRGVSGKRVGKPTTMTRSEYIDRETQRWGTTPEQEAAEFDRLAAAQAEGAAAEPVRAKPGKITWESSVLPAISGPGGSLETQTLRTLVDGKPIGIEISKRRGFDRNWSKWSAEMPDGTRIEASLAEEARMKVKAWIESQEVSGGSQIKEVQPTPKPVRQLKALKIPGALPPPVTPVAQGTNTKIYVSGMSDEIPAKYAVMEAESLVPSHVVGGRTLTPHPSYPSGLQPRDYQALGEQAAIERFAKEKRGEYFVNTSPTPLDGPPSVTSEGIVLNGSKRTMTLQLAAQRGDFAWAKQTLADQAKLFGIDPETVLAAKNPVLVRVVEMDPLSPEAATFARLGNIPTTQAQSFADLGASLSSVVPDSVLEAMRGAPDATLGDILSEPTQAKAFREAIEAALPASMRSQVFTDLGAFTEEGKILARDILFGKVFPPQTVKAMPAKLKRTLEASLPQLLDLKRGGGMKNDYNVLGAIQEAVEFYVGPLEGGAIAPADYFGQGQMFEAHAALINPGARMMLDAIWKNGEKPRVFRDSLLAYVNNAQAEGGLFKDPEDPASLVGRTFQVEPQATATFGYINSEESPIERLTKARRPEAASIRQAIDAQNAQGQPPGSVGAAGAGFSGQVGQPGPPGFPPGPATPEGEAFFSGGRNLPEPTMRTWMQREVARFNKNFSTKVEGAFAGEAERKQFAKANELLRLRKIAQNLAIRDAADDMYHNLSPAGDQRQVDAVMNYMVAKSLESDAARGLEIPLNIIQVKAEIAAYEQLLKDNPNLTEVYKRTRDMLDAGRDTLIELGLLDPLRATDPHYIPHKVLEHWQTGFISMAERGFLKGKEGTTKQILTDYLEVMMDWDTKVRFAVNMKRIHDQIAKEYGIWKSPVYDPTAVVNVGGKPYKWYKFSPRGYDVAFEPADEIFDDVHAAVAAEAELAPGATKPGIRPRVESKGDAYLIPAKLADHLHSLRPSPIPSNILNKATRGWKSLVIGVFHPIRYNIKNFATDTLEVAWGVQPGMLKPTNMIRALQMERRAAKGDIDPLYRDAMEASVTGSGQAAVEAGKMKDMKALEDLMIHLDPSSAPRIRFRNLAHFMVRMAEHRENWFRLSSYLYNRDRISKGLPIHTGASDKAALAGMTPEQGAGVVARELFVDYLNFTDYENRMRNGPAPFYSWLVGNPIRFAKAVKNNPLGVTARLAALYAAFYTWNHTGEREEQEKRLSERNRSRFHLNTGKRNPDGTDMVIFTDMATTEIMDYFGLTPYEVEVKMVLHGELPMKEFVRRLGSRAYGQTIGKVYGAVNPMIRAVPEQTLGVTLGQQGQRRPARGDISGILSESRTMEDLAKAEESRGDIVRRFAMREAQLRQLSPAQEAMADVRYWVDQFLAQRGLSQGDVNVPGEAEAESTEDRARLIQLLSVGSDEEVRDQMRIAAAETKELMVEKGYPGTVDPVAYLRAAVAANLKGRNPLLGVPAGLRKDFVVQLRADEAKWARYQEALAGIRTAMQRFNKEAARLSPAPSAP